MINTDSTSYQIEKNEFYSDKCAYCMKYTDANGNCTNNFCCSYNLIEEGIIHTEGLSYEDAIEMEERHNATFPDTQFWIEPTYFRV